MTISPSRNRLEEQANQMWQTQVRRTLNRTVVGSNPTGLIGFFRSSRRRSTLPYVGLALDDDDAEYAGPDRDAAGALPEGRIVGGEAFDGRLIEIARVVDAPDEAKL
jgi:hypothetical protein